MFNTALNKFYQFDLPFTNEMLTRDFKMQKKLQDDGLTGKIVTAKFYFALKESLKKIHRTAQHIDIPVYILQAGNDLLVDIISVKEVFGCLNSNVKELNILPGFFHSLSIDKNREMVFQLMEKWINKVMFLEDSIKEDH